MPVGYYAQKNLVTEEPEVVLPIKQKKKAAPKKRKYSKNKTTKK